MKATLSAILLLTGSLAVTAQNNNDSNNIDELRQSARFIPVIYYSPIEFECSVVNSFSFDSDKPAYFIKTDSTKPELYYYSDLAHRGEFKATRVSTDIPLSTDQLSKLATSDSTFIFAPYPTVTSQLIPQHISYIGYRDKGRTRFMNHSRTFDTLADFITYEFGSTENFAARYLEAISAAFKSGGSNLYAFESDDAAVSFLKNDYKFQAITGNEADKVIPLFISLVKETLSLSPEREQRLTTICHNAYTPSDKTTANFLSGKTVCIFPLKIFRPIFSPDECEVISGIIATNDSRLNSAYRRLFRAVANTNPDGSYRTDRDILSIINTRIK